MSDSKKVLIDVETLRSYIISDMTVGTIMQIAEESSATTKLLLATANEVAQSGMVDSVLDKYFEKEQPKVEPKRIITIH